MIQRIQSLYFLLATAAYVSLFFFPFAKYTKTAEAYELSVLGLTQGHSLVERTDFLLAGVVLLILLTLTIIFLYKKRMVQSKMTAATLLINVALIAGMFFYSDYFADTNGTAQYTAGSIIVLVPLVFLYLANRAIRKDEMKVRAADRLR